MNKTFTVTWTLLIFIVMGANISFAGSIEDNYIKQIDRDIVKMEQFASGAKKMNPNQMQRSFPRKIANFEKKIIKLQKKDGSGKRLQSKLNYCQLPHEYC